MFISDFHIWYIVQCTNIKHTNFNYSIGDNNIKKNILIEALCITYSGSTIYKNTIITTS